jgi:hypothetical protein
MSFDLSAVGLAKMKFNVPSLPSMSLSIPSLSMGNVCAALNSVKQNSSSSSVSSKQGVVASLWGEGKVGNLVTTTLPSVYNVPSVPSVLGDSLKRGSNLINSIASTPTAIYQQTVGKVESGMKSANNIMSLSKSFF